MNLSPEEKELGKQNFDEATGTTRRDFLKGSILAGGVATAGLGAAYFNYGGSVSDRLRVAILGTGDEGGVLMGALNPAYIDVRAICDIRPYSRHRAFHGDWYSAGAHAARPGLIDVYGWSDEDQARENVKVYEGSYRDMLNDSDLPDIEAVIIALPLHLHDDAAILAMRNGYHVLTEKLMGHSVGQCKEMARVADETGKILATGHQRHYSILYDNAVQQIKQGLIGDIHHIRAQWHRANLPGSDSWQPPLPTEMLPPEELANRIRAARAEGREAEVRAVYKLVDEYYAWKRVVEGNHPTVKPRGAEMVEWEKKLAQKHAQLQDIAVDAGGYGYEEKTLVPSGYQCSPLEELIRWRLWDRTGGGLMAELGSHQLDAASIFLTAQDPEGHKALPLSVVAVGGRHIFPQDRDVEDHVYCQFEFPAAGYYRDYESKVIDDPNKKIVVSYSSINGNGYGGWGEVVLGTEGTLILEREQEAMLFKGSDTSTRIEVNERGGGAVMDTYETGGGAALAQTAAPTEVSRGYREEMEHWAWCIKSPDPANQPRCKPSVALADAVIALTSNLAIAQGGRIDFEPEWFDIQSDATPEGKPPRQAGQIA